MWEIKLELIPTITVIAISDFRTENSDVNSKNENFFSNLLKHQTKNLFRSIL